MNKSTPLAGRVIAGIFIGLPLFFYIVSNAAAPSSPPMQQPVIYAPQSAAPKRDEMSAEFKSCVALFAGAYSIDHPNSSDSEALMHGSDYCLARGLEPPSGPR